MSWKSLQLICLIPLHHLSALCILCLHSLSPDQGFHIIPMLDAASFQKIRGIHVSHSFIPLWFCLHMCGSTIGRHRGSWDMKDQIDSNSYVHQDWAWCVTFFKASALHQTSISLLREVFGHKEALVCLIQSTRHAVVVCLGDPNCMDFGLARATNSPCGVKQINFCFVGAFYDPERNQFWRIAYICQAVTHDHRLGEQPWHWYAEASGEVQRMYGLH